MGAIKEFIKENSPKVPQKKKKRVRLKNFNPFRKRKYKTLNEESQDLERHEQKSSSGMSKSTQGTESQAQKRRRPLEFLQAAWENLGSAKGNPGDPNSEGRKKARRHGSAECLIEEEAATDVIVGEGGKTDPKAAISQSENASGDKPDSGNVRSEIKQVTISDEIEVIETSVTDEQAPPQKIKKKKSAKKKLKKAGINTVKMLGHGMTNMAVAFQYMSPEVVITPVARDIAERREERYRQLAGMAYAMAS